jgi:glycopeptide antibiotics resistance protein
VTAVVGGSTRSTQSRRRLQLAFGAYAALLAWILFWPSGDIASWVVAHATEAFLDLGSPGGVVTGARMEFALNAAMVVPLVALAVLLWPRLSWERWTAYAFVTSCAVELAQGLLLPMRSAQLADVVSNTLGAGVGAILGRLLLVQGRRRARASSGNL